MPDNCKLFPEEIVLEVTNVCNLKCRHCHFHGQSAPEIRRTGFTDRKVWEKVLKELETCGKKATLMTHGAGEPLLYRQLPELLQRAKNIPNISLGFMTNGMLLDDEWARRLVDFQLDFIAFSIDGVNPSTHDHYRKNADLRIIEQNVHNLIQEKTRKKTQLPHLSFNMVCYPEIKDQAMDYVRKWLPHASVIHISKFRPVGSRLLWDQGEKVDFRPCPLLGHQLVIGVDGKTGLCCEDIHLEVQTGDIMLQNMEEIFNFSSILNKYRQKHHEHSIIGLKLCHDCHVWGGDIATETDMIDLGGIQADRKITHAFEVYRIAGNQG